MREKGMHHKLEKEQARNWAQLESSLHLFRVDREYAEQQSWSHFPPVPHASWSLVWACLGVCLGRRSLPNEAVRMRGQFTVGDCELLADNICDS